MNENDGLPLVARVFIKGETPAHTELLANIDHWCNEIRSAATDTSGGWVWVEKIRFQTNLPAPEKYLQKSDGAIGELLTLFNEIASTPEALSELSYELKEIEKKIPKELEKDLERLRFDDPDWIGEMLEQVRPMLLQRLMRGGNSQ
jgi:hypothetical protein